MNGRERLLGAALGVGFALACFGSELLWGDPSRAWSSLLSSWLFFAGAVTGAVALQAILALTGARWAEPALRPLAGLVAFLPWAGALLIVLLLGQSQWMIHTGPADSFRSAWLAPAWLGLRELVATAVLFTLATRVVRRPAAGAGTIAYLVIYGVVLSLWAVDFVVAPDGEWTSTLAGGHLFVGAWASGTALLALLAETRGLATTRIRQDLGRVILVGAALWGYLAWSQFLPTWYANLPDEIRFALARGRGGWGAVSLTVIACTLVIPFVSMLVTPARTTRAGFGIAAGSMLLGLWLERLLLVTPSLVRGGAPFGGVECAIAVGLAVALVMPAWDGGHEVPAPVVR